MDVVEVVMGDSIRPYSRQRAYQLRHQAIGLCLHCCTPASRGSLCDKHYEAQAIHARNRYRRLHGLPMSHEPVKPQARTVQP